METNLHDRRRHVEETLVAAVIDVGTPRTIQQPQAQQPQAQPQPQPPQDLPPTRQTPLIFSPRVTCCSSFMTSSPLPSSSLNNFVYVDHDHDNDHDDDGTATTSTTNGDGHPLNDNDNNASSAPPSPPTAMRGLCRPDFSSYSPIRTNVVATSSALLWSSSTNSNHPITTINATTTADATTASATTTAATTTTTADATTAITTYDSCSQPHQDNDDDDDDDHDDSTANEPVVDFVVDDDEAAAAAAAGHNNSTPINTRTFSPRTLPAAPFTTTSRIIDDTNDENENNNDKNNVGDSNNHGDKIDATSSPPPPPPPASSSFSCLNHTLAQVVSLSNSTHATVQLEDASNGEMCHSSSSTTTITTTTTTMTTTTTSTTTPKTKNQHQSMPPDTTIKNGLEEEKTTFQTPPTRISSYFYPKTMDDHPQDVRDGHDNGQMGDDNLVKQDATILPSSFRPPILVATTPPFRNASEHFTFTQMLREEIDCGDGLVFQNVDSIPENHFLHVPGVRLRPMKVKPKMTQKKSGTKRKYSMDANDDSSQSKMFYSGRMSLAGVSVNLGSNHLSSAPAAAALDIANKLYWGANNKRPYYVLSEAEVLRALGAVGYGTEVHPDEFVHSLFTLERKEYFELLVDKALSSLGGRDDYYADILCSLDKGGSSFYGWGDTTTAAKPKAKNHSKTKTSSTTTSTASKKEESSMKEELSYNGKHVIFDIDNKGMFSWRLDDSIQTIVSTTDVSPAADSNRK